MADAIAGLGGVPGFRDVLPDEAEVLRQAQESLLAEMRRWGYRQVITPLVEGMDGKRAGLGDAAFACGQRVGVELAADHEIGAIALDARDFRR